jgi:hypothetical protein
MSHFLERLAAGVAQPASHARLRPLVGSVFAPSPQIGLAESGPIESSVLSSLSRTHRSATRGEEGQSGEERGEHQGFPLLRAQRQSESLTARKTPERSTFQPLISAINPVTPFEAPLLGPNVSMNAAGSEQAKQSGPEIDSQLRLSSTDVPLSYRPLVRAEGGAAGVPTPHQGEFGTAKNPGAEAPGRPASPLHEPDEIHIHIGRIEVAAISQPAPRPAAPPARKSLDLGEYLKRGNRRSG